MFRTTLIAALVAAAPAFAQEDVTLKKGPGLDEVTAACSVCHTLAYITMNAPFLPPAGWKAEVAKMRVIFGGPFDEATAEAVEKYLVANYGAAPKP